MGKIAFLFTGQGSQHPGMGKDVYDQFSIAHDFLNQVNASLDFDLLSLLFESDIDTLSLTENTQPTLVAVQIMILLALKEQGLKPDLVAGLSLGEFSALVASGAIDSFDVIGLVRKRGEIMSLALPVGETGMAAVMGLDDDALREICQEVSPLGAVEIANYNCPMQRVIAGEIDALNRAMEIATLKGARKVIPLAVSGAFHTSLLKNASHEFRKYIDKLQVSEVITPVVFNETAHSEITCLKQMMMTQMCHSVRFEESIRYMINEGVDKFVEIGPGKTLSGFVKKVDRTVKTYQVATAEDIWHVVKELKVNE